MKIKYGECHCGCGEKTKIAVTSSTRDKHTKGKPIYFITGHNRRKSPVDYKIDKNGCWVWQKCIRGKGYGCVYPKGSKKAKIAHRYYYEMYKGKIPEGLEIDHLCRNRACVNPEHLEAVTSRVNNLRGFGVAGKNARKTHCKNGHEFTKENTYTQPKKPTSRYCRICGRIRTKSWANKRKIRD